MKFRKIVNPKWILVFAALTLISCNNILVGKNKTKSNERLTRIETNKLEAKLLVKVSKNNLIILQICEEIEGVEIALNVETDNNIKILIDNLEKTHFELSKNYKTLAEEKLISIPIELTINSEINETDNINFIKENLNEILNKIDCQIKLLNRLAKITNQIEFKILATKDSFKLKSNTSKIENVLGELKNHLNYNKSIMKKSILAPGIFASSMLNANTILASHKNNEGHPTLAYQWEVETECDILSGTCLSMEEVNKEISSRTQDKKILKKNITPMTIGNSLTEGVKIYTWKVITKFGESSEYQKNLKTQKTG